MRIIVAIAFALLALNATPARACGANGEHPCGGNCEWYLVGACPFCAPWCQRNPLVCQAGNEIQTVYSYGSDKACVATARPVPPPGPPPAPAIQVEALPATIDIGTETLTTVQGFFATVEVDRVDFVTPESDIVSPNKQYVVNVNGTSRPANCEEIHGTDAAGQVWKHALLPLDEWHDLYPVNLLVNANWFDVLAPFQSPHINLCSNVFGLFVSKGRQISGAEVMDGRNLLDSLLLVTTMKNSSAFVKAVIVRNAGIKQYNMPQFAVSGFIILEDGKVVSSPSSNSPTFTFSRTAVGLSADGKKMFIFVEQQGKFYKATSGLTAAQMAGLMKHYGASTAINLDNSGSSQMVYYKKATDPEPEYRSLKGDGVSCSTNLRNPCTPEEHRLEEDDVFIHRWRPVPNFLGIKVND